MNKLIFKLFPQIFILIICSNCQSQDQPQEPEELKPDEFGNITRVMQSAQETRSFIVHFPATYQQGDQLPLVISLHGRSTDNKTQMSYTGMNQVADKHNFIVVYPQGLEVMIQGSMTTQWNVSDPNGTKDVAFMTNLIDLMHQDYNIDLERVYATGFSNGALMSFRLACELSDKIAAIAPVGGNLPLAQKNNCILSHPVPILYIHGTEDTYVPIEGIPSFTISSEATIEYFVNLYQCKETPEETQIPDHNKEDQSTAKYFVYVDCNEGSEVQYYEMEGAGHTWPDALEAEQLGATNRDFNGSQVIWEFLSRFEHPDPK